MKKKITLFAVLVAVIVAGIYFTKFYLSKDLAARPQDVAVDTTDVKELTPMVYRFGLPVDSFEVLEGVVKNGESFGNILLANGVGYSVINKIATDFKDVFDVRWLRSGKPYSLFCESNDSSRVAKYMVYQSSAVEYYVFDLQDSVNVYSGKKDVTTKVHEVSGEINSSLYQTLVEKGASVGIAMKLADVYAWSIDFFRIQKGDYFKVIYEEKYIDDTVNVGVGRIIAADFNHGGTSFYAFHFDRPDENYSDYFDENGKTLRKAFLKAPLDFYRISSRYNPKRFHPVQKRWKAHLGTDYAAPTGTPIMATADGEVIAAAYTRGNGNYVKVRHNSTYTTQYLHMSKFAKGTKKGRIVKQGDIIGYVGSTGLATGPHVCYRFWKNGKQVDPYSQKLPEADPIKEKYKADYEAQMTVLKARLDKLPVEGAETDPEIHLASVGG
ncbi:metalloendopeptidase-like membrane protein [Owenweeksia hongkongensis DSM 17368]|uniref:Metalloendopeptidase-like membrane protein n=1 Tax=Owenweeksia hongkongensis (strain DSM 17368 / CIP 108786 / JCM 12287 / NRRL B-23963 / UST20020801) TaxID=926562 RepID=G8R046_OWEHD|nr:peptidoglycan DD-metalloendopeptidase family protein [Owenweeksia hongkongensis]AEV33712.1 metalloendopeptidase-like membrane protein [Owenweeksia hongkongensis DSM 17368]